MNNEFVNLLNTQILKNRKRTAISSFSESISYEKLNSKSLKIASIIEQMRLSKSVVGIVGQRNFSVYYGILASIYAGCTYVPINEKYKLDAFNKIVKDSKIKVLVGEYNTLNVYRDAIINSEVECIVIPDGDISELDYFSDNIDIFTIDEIDSFNEGKQIDITPDKTLYILYTSGSTGQPKGVKVSHENVYRFLLNTDKFYSLEPGYRSSQTFDLSFDASVVDIYLTWINGGELCLLGHNELIMPFDYIVRENIEFWYSVPTLSDFMLKMGYLKPNSFPNLKYSLFGGEPLKKELADAWQKSAPNSTVENVYGPTEATVNVFRFKYDSSSYNKIFKNGILPIGKVFDEHEFKIVDSDLKPTSDDESGHLIFKGPQVSQGYLNDITKTSDVFRNLAFDKSNDIWYLSGDLAYINDFGDVECLGRLDDQIKISGRRIELGEIEHVLMETKLLKDVVVVPIRNESNLVLQLVAFTTTELDDEIINSVIQSSLAHIEKLFLPKRIYNIKEFPLSQSGKTNRKKLEELARDTEN